MSVLRQDDPAHAGPPRRNRGVRQGAAGRRAPAQGRGEGTPARRHAPPDRGPEAQGRAGLAAGAGRSRRGRARGAPALQFPSDDITAIGQGVRGADVHQVVIDSRNRKSGSILWECKNARNWSDRWLAKLKQDQRSLHADLAVLVSAVLPKGCTRVALIDGVLVTDFASAPCLAAILRENLFQLAQARNATMHKEERLELLHRYLSGVAFRQRVGAVVEP